MTHDHEFQTDPGFEDAVRETAYLMWERDERPDGREKEYWFKALEAHLGERNGDAKLDAASTH